MKILGIGNALVDVLTQINDDSLLTKFQLPKGSMTLVDKGLSDIIYSYTSSLLQLRSSGGCAANTIHGLSHLGIATSYIGKIGNDELGEFFREDMQISKINPILYNSLSDTGRAMALISPDSERTFATYLGAASELSGDDLTSEIFNGYQYVYLEGYLVYNTSLIEKALRLAKLAGSKQCLDLSSYNIVENHRSFLLSIIREYVDIVFANEEEARALTGKEPEEAVDMISELCEIAVVKTGAKGSLIKSGNQNFQIEAFPSIVKDTTGAGDLYASGFLYGQYKGLSLEKSGKIGSLLASKVIEQIGAKMNDSIWQQIITEIKKIEK